MMQGRQADGSFLLWPNGAPEPDGVPAKEQPSLLPMVATSKSPVGAVIVCPGGGYSGRAPHEDGPIGDWLNRVGISAFCLRYRVAPHKHPAPLMDALRAIRMVRANAREWNVKPDKIGILGFSAGGHLAASAATCFGYEKASVNDHVDSVSDRPDAAILCYPVISFDVHRHHGSMVNLLGENPPEALRKSLCLEDRVTSNTPPCFLWHTSDDSAVPVENSLVFAQSLSRNKVPHELHIFPHGTHGLGLAPGDPVVSCWAGLCATWLKQLGF